MAAPSLLDWEIIGEKLAGFRQITVLLKNIQMCKALSNDSKWRQIKEKHFEKYQRQAGNNKGTHKNITKYKMVKLALSLKILFKEQSLQASFYLQEEMERWIFLGIRKAVDFETITRVRAGLLKFYKFT